MHELVEHSDVTVSGMVWMENFLLRYRVAYPDPVLTLTRDGVTIHKSGWGFRTGDAVIGTVDMDGLEKIVARGIILQLS